MNKKNILIFGGCGLIGKTFVDTYLEKNTNLIVLDKIKKKFKNKNIYFYKINKEKKESLKKQFKKIFKRFKKIDTVINLAYPKGSSWGKKFEKINSRDIKNNLFLQLGTSILVAQISILFF